MKKKVLVIASHHDDEVFGCTGSILKHKLNGDEINIIFTADGYSSRKYTNKKENPRYIEFKKVNKILNFKSVHHLDFLDNQMDKFSNLEITIKIEKIFNQIKPNIIYTHHPNDLNIDHRKTSEAVLTVLRSKNLNKVEKILFFEIVSSSHQFHNKHNQFVPNYFVDISKFINLKLKLCKIYNLELDKFKGPRSLEAIKSLAIFRGSQVNVKYAEAFEAFRVIT